jgi:hypothetical protein
MENSQDFEESSSDERVSILANFFRVNDPGGIRIAKALRKAFDFLYAGSETGRFKWEQLSNVEKNQWWAIAKIHIHREFRFNDGDTLDFRIEGVEVACIIAKDEVSLVFPTEALNQISLIFLATDDANPRWSFGIFEPASKPLSPPDSSKFDFIQHKSWHGPILWMHRNSPLPQNALPKLPEQTVDQILLPRTSGERINELFRSSHGLIIRGADLATVAQQDDYMKRVRTNGGARSSLKPEGIIILGQYESHARIATQLNLPRPGKGDFVSARVVLASKPGDGVAMIGDSLWRVANDRDKVEPAPDLPKI